jgi:hypothetical protein
VYQLFLVDRQPLPLLLVLDGLDRRRRLGYKRSVFKRLSGGQGQGCQIFLGKTYGNNGQGERER